MHWLELPSPLSDSRPAFTDVASAKTWLATQPQAQPLRMLDALAEQLRAIDGGGLPPPVCLDLLEVLRRSIVTLEASVNSRFLRKALPMQAEDQRMFDAAQQLWASLGIAYLRLAGHFAPADKVLPLHRAAVAIRHAQLCHFQAAQVLPPLLDRLLFGVLAQAESAGIQRQAIRDPGFPEYEESNIAGQVAWAFLLRLIDPYHLSAAQLAVTNRAFSRWRELASFQAMPDDDPKARAVPLDTLFGARLPEGIPAWLDVRPIARKMRRRVESLHAGESPESLKLGRELSVAACIRLFDDLNEHLGQRLGTPSTEVGEIELLFGAEHAYALFSGKPLQAQSMSEKSTAVANQRMALFGFDRVSQMPNAVRKLNLPTEAWQFVDGRLVRSADVKMRRQSPCLVAALNKSGPALGVLGGLQARPDGSLTAHLRWYPAAVEACVLRVAVAPGAPPPAISAFLLHEEEGLAVIVSPSAGLRLNVGVALECASVEHLLPLEVLERGADFVRYACAAV